MIRETGGWMDARTCRARAGGRSHRTCSRWRRPAATRSHRQRRHLAGMTPCRYPWEQWGSQETDALHAIDRLLSRAWPSRHHSPTSAMCSLAWWPSRGSRAHGIIRSRDEGARALILAGSAAARGWGLRASASGRRLRVRRGPVGIRDLLH